MDFAAEYVIEIVRCSYYPRMKSVAAAHQTTNKTTNTNKFANEKLQIKTRSRPFQVEGTPFELEGFESLNPRLSNGITH